MHVGHVLVGVGDHPPGQGGGFLASMWFELPEDDGQHEAQGDSGVEKHRVDDAVPSRGGCGTNGMRLVTGWPPFMWKISRTCMIDAPQPRFVSPIQLRKILRPSVIKSTQERPIIRRRCATKPPSG